MKISRRLQRINEMVTGDYDHIWDCCCDHGLLGMLLLERRAAPWIHFVDCVAPLMQQLTLELQQFFPTKQANSLTLSSVAVKEPNAALNDSHRQKSDWQVHCLDVAELPFHQVLNAAQTKQLIIIAGVGGEYSLN